MQPVPSLFDSLMEGAVVHVDSYVRRSKRGNVTRVDSHSRTSVLRALPDVTPGIADSPGENAHAIARTLHYQRFDPPRARGAAARKVSSAELNRIHVRIVGLTAKINSQRLKGASTAETVRELRRALSAYLVGGGTATSAVTRARVFTKRPKRIRESLMDSLMERRV